MNFRMLFMVPLLFFISSYNHFEIVEKNLNNTFFGCKSIVEIYTDSSTIELVKDDFTFLENEIGFDLIILNKTS